SGRCAGCQASTSLKAANRRGAPDERIATLWCRISDAPSTPVSGGEQWRVKPSQHATGGSICTSAPRAAFAARRCPPPPNSLESGISLWPPSGLFIATLVLTSRHSWPWWVLGGCLAELFSNVLWFHNPLPVAFLLYTGNALEAAAGAWLVNRTCRRPVRLGTCQAVR